MDFPKLILWDSMSLKLTFNATLLTSKHFIILECWHLHTATESIQTPFKSNNSLSQLPHTNPKGMVWAWIKPVDQTASFQLAAVKTKR